MAISLIEEFKTVEELRQSTDAIVAQVRESGQPVSITLEGKPAVVMLDAKVFEHMLRTLNLARLMGPAEEDLRAGRTKPLDQFMREFCLANQIPPADLPQPRMDGFTQPGYAEMENEEADSIT
jgi:PHD/YefM family antitoxin component YafN of YafNO toxin-antitoxin module